MEREDLIKYKENRKELALLNKGIERLVKKLESLPEIMGKVQSTMDDFPYVPMRVSVLMTDPKETDKLKSQIASKQKRISQIEKQIAEVDNFIDSLPHGVDRDIYEMVFQEGMSQYDVGKIIGYSQGAVKKRIWKCFEEAKSTQSTQNDVL